ncbi:hypothetical protein ACFS7Z_17715 [Pontibacter toksunensis]|uniref:Outer membrane protein with beta-barrel domain n=1 Tax=Pontibacter toksunensis TaxID=1332631 RepID=A0ABW6BWY9_9BACT
MKNHLLSLIAVCCFISLLVAPSVSAQIIYIGDPSSAATQKRFNEIFSKNQDSESVPVALAELLPENTINTADLALTFPKHKIPFELLKVKLPVLTDYTDTLVVLWYLRKPENVKAGTVNVMLIAQDAQKKLAYFIDENNNRDLSDDGSPFFFEEGEKQRQVDIEDKRIGTLSFVLQNLEAAVAAPAQPEIAPYGTNEKSEKVVIAPDEKPPFAIHFISGLSSGSGKALLSYRELPRPDSDESDKTYTYNASYYASLHTTMGIAASLYNFYIGVSGSMELFEVGEQYLVEEFSKQGVPSRQLNHNTGYWPNMRLNLNGFMEYDFVIVNNLRFAPTASFTRYNFIQNHSFVLNGEKDINDYFTERYSYSFGGKVKYAVNNKSLFFLEVSSRFNHFNASSYFPYLEPESFNMKFKQFYGGIGLQVKLASFK